MKAKKVKDIINETGGAGYSTQGSYAGTGGRGMGFGGSSNVGGPNLMYTYSIVPLSHVLEPKTDTKEEFETVHIGDEISGKRINKQEPNKKYTGTLLSIYKSPETNEILYYLILDQKTNTKIKIDPNTVEILNPNQTANPGELTGDYIEGEYIKNESLKYTRAIKVNEKK